MTHPVEQRAFSTVTSPGPTLTELVRAWPADEPLAVVCEAGGGPLLCAPTHAEVLCDPAAGAERVRALFGNDAQNQAGKDLVGRGWVVLLGYEMGAAFEPTMGDAARGSAPAGAGGRTGGEPWPPLVLFRVQGCVRLGSRGWAIAGDPDAVPSRVRDFIAGDDAGVGIPLNESCARFCAGALNDPAGESSYVEGVKRVLGYIRAGDCYQVNLARTLRAPFGGSARSFFAALVESAAPMFGVYAEHTHAGVRRALCSASPELFLEVQQGRIRARPMKGTRPIGSPEAELRDAAKDRAELDMIVDIMRNDLGRVAAFGSVDVQRPRDIERHGDSVLQATSTVQARLREDASLADLLSAAFPPASVTGAPKIRATQIIRELEAFRRGPYCGSAGWIGDDGRAVLNVAIRTASVVGEPASGGLDRFASGAEVSYPVGAGIVADSDPVLELAESALKAEVCTRVIECESREQKR